jgi:hypothetical protein
LGGTLSTPLPNFGWTLCGTRGPPLSDRCDGRVAPAPAPDFVAAVLQATLFVAAANQAAQPVVPAPPLAARVDAAADLNF